MLKTERFILRYVRMGDYDFAAPNPRQPVGAIIVLENGDFGWSKCAKNDSFNKYRAVEIAIGRAEKGDNILQTFITDIHQNPKTQRRGVPEKWYDVYSNIIDKMREKMERIKNGTQKV